jgi:hypothetical protein
MLSMSTYLGKGIFKMILIFILWVIYMSFAGKFTDYQGLSLVLIGCTLNHVAALRRGGR